ncbi:hypothetical protein M1523_01045 [Patescibacteria group bacterium]|nr:hypothetical protein [Patescibacteria group bacterium]MCL5091743.1 hypothetical protein [Patescibacteria group bacterium]
MKKTTKSVRSTVSKNQVDAVKMPAPKPKSRLALVAFAAVLVVAVGWLFRNISSQNAMTRFKANIIPEVVKKIINSPSTKFEIGSVKDVSGVYQFELTLKTGADQKYTSYITKDGKILFVSGINTASLGQVKGQSASSQAKAMTCNDVPKTAAPKLTAFVMSNCPYGLQMLRAMTQALNEQPALANNFDVKYIGSIDNGKIISLHGEQEAQEDLKQVCIREEQPSKYWDYLACYMKEGKSDECSTQTGIDTTQLNACTADKNRGLAYVQKDFNLADKLNIGSSPTLVLNDKTVVSEFDFGGRVPNALQQIVCCGSSNKGDYCNQALSKNEVATSFSVSAQPSNQNTNSSAANCGN